MSTQRVGKRAASTLAALVLGVVTCAGGCEGDDPYAGVGHGGGVVGGACFSSADCAERCLQGGDYPDGTCSLTCSSDFDCPAGTSCIDREGGVCLLACSHVSHCRIGYNCADENRRGADGAAWVCINQ